MIVSGARASYRLVGVFTSLKAKEESPCPCGEKWKYAIAKARPVGRLATSGEIAYGVLHPALQESSFVTGTELVVAGGLAAH